MLFIAVHILLDKLPHAPLPPAQALSVSYAHNLIGRGLSECSQRRYVPLLSKHVRLQTINKTPCLSDKNGEAFGCVINLRHG